MNAIPVTDKATSSSTNAIPTSSVSTSAGSLPSNALGVPNTALPVGVAAVQEDVLSYVTEEQHCSDSEWCWGEGAFALTLIAQNYDSDSCVSDA